MEHLGRMAAAEKNSRTALQVAEDLQKRVSQLEQREGRKDSVIQQLQEKVAQLEHKIALMQAKELSGN